ncbi:dystrophin-like protein 1 isoform X2 [Dendronephthya gigantea]|nr:dystrophin-like protein 1 isoform X2 [Dendronephthya gigantea]
MPVVNFNKWAYRLVEDRHDGMGKVPVFDQEAFQLGITFKAKYVGTLEITRPTCRTEIVTAMRKVRYEFKIKGIEKRRVFLTISVDGIKVTLRKRRRRLRKEYLLDEDPVVLHEHQIGRIFYVSHDSMDLKIFSYITKDNFDNQFRCSVFKAYRKSKALFMVRTIGQAFEVCHRLQQDTSEDGKEDESATKVDERVLADEGTDIDAVDQDSNDKTTEIPEKPTPAALVEISQLLPSVDPDGKIQPFTAEQLRLLFNQRLEHYIQETEVCKAENRLLKDQLMLERNGRVQAQEREQCLLQKNRELLQTIQTLANRLQTVSPGYDSLSTAFTTTHHSETLVNPSYPSTYSTQLKNDNFGNTCAQIGLDGDQVEITGNSLVITPPADTIATFDPLASKIAPLAKFKGSTNVAQSTVGHYWKTFDEDGVISPGSGADDSSSESSDDENFSENFIGHKIIPAEERNGWVPMENTPNGTVKKHDGNGHAVGLGTSAYPDQQNGLVHNDLKTLHSSNNNHQGSKVPSTDTRTAIQTDF